MTDDLERVRNAARKMSAAQRERDDAITDAVGHGESQADVARAAGISRQRVGQIMQGAGTGPERAFWGAPGGEVTIAVGEKIEAPKDASGPLGPVLTREVRDAYDILRGMLDAAGLSAEYEGVPPPGAVKLNREGLVVVCGPRLSPLVAQVLESDQVLRFAKDDDGWHLTDKSTGRTWRSPMDRGEMADIGYLGRLPRPDGQGTFVYLGGIHAAGIAGAARYLEGSLPHLWREVRASRFSALVRCTLTEQRKVIASELVAGPYLHER